MTNPQPHRLLLAGSALSTTRPLRSPTAGQPAATPPVAAAPARPDAADRPVSLRDALTVIFRHKAKVAVFLFSTAAAAWVFTAREVATYTSEALLLLRPGREGVAFDPTVTAGETAPVRQELDQAINSELSILRSRELTRELVDLLGPETLLTAASPSASSGGPKWRLPQWRKFVPGAARVPAPPTPDGPQNAAIALLRDAIQVEAVERSSVIRVVCTLVNPELAQRVVEQMLAICGERRATAYRRPGSLAFFQAQTAECQQRLRQADDALRRAKNDLSIASLQTEQSATAARIELLRTRKQELGDRLAAAGAEHAALSQRIEADRNAKPMPSPETFKDRLLALQAAELTLRSLQQELVTTESHLASALTALKTLNDNESTLHDLQRERDLIEANYVKYAARLEEARISVALEAEKISNVSVIQAATRPLEANPTHTRLLRIIALLLGIGGGLGIAFVSESLDDTVRWPEDLARRLGLQTLVSLPRLKRRHIGLRVRHPPGTAEDSGRVCRLAPLAAPHFDILVHHALQAMTCGVPQPTLIGVTSCYPGEGVTTVARNLAVALAGAGGPAQPTLLVEPSTQQMSWLPFLDRNLGPRATEFRTDQAGETAVIEHSVYKVSAGERPPPPVTEMRGIDLVRHARECDASFVLFDLSPLSEGVAAEKLAAWMDYVLVVVESERVRWPILAQAHARLAKTNVALLGAVLNKRRYHIPSWLYRRL